MLPAWCVSVRPGRLQVQQDVAEAVTAIADRAATGTFEEPAAPPLPAAICSLPVSELQARAQQQRDVQEGFAAQARELEARLPPESQRRLEAVQSQMALQPAEVRGLPQTQSRGVVFVKLPGGRGSASGHLACRWNGRQSGGLGAMWCMR